MYAFGISLSGDENIPLCMNNYKQCNCNCYRADRFSRSTSPIAGNIRNNNIDFQSRIEYIVEGDEDPTRIIPDRIKGLKPSNDIVIDVPSLRISETSKINNGPGFQAQSYEMLSTMKSLFPIMLLTLATSIFVHTHAAVYVTPFLTSLTTANILPASQVSIMYRYVTDRVIPQSLETLQKMLIMEFWRRAWGETWKIGVKYWDTVWDSVPSVCTERRIQILGSIYDCPAWLSELDAFLFSTFERGSKKLLEKGAERNFWMILNSFKDKSLSVVSSIFFNVRSLQSESGLSI